MQKKINRNKKQNKYRNNTYSNRTAEDELKIKKQFKTILKTA
ncbi:MAG: hypothetical protein ACOCUI_00945 [bacterium]